MEMVLWNSAIVLSKAAFYAGFACLAGCLFLPRPAGGSSHYHAQLFHYVTPVLLLSLLACPLWFLAKTGAFSESGIAGAIDPMMLNIMLQSPIGEVTLYRSITLALSLPAIYGLLKLQRGQSLCRFLLLALFGCGLYSFTLTGHVAEKGATDKIVLVTHVAIMAWWFGSLVPLKLTCAHLPTDETQQIMAGFGKVAGILVAALLLLGGYMAYGIFSAWHQLITSNYGLTLVAKLVLVGILLVIAARHKFVLVPNLTGNQHTTHLKRSLNIEIIVAGVLLLITAGLTSVVGPDFK